MKKLTLALIFLAGVYTQHAEAQTAGTVITYSLRIKRAAASGSAVRWLHSAAYATMTLMEIAP